MQRPPSIRVAVLPAWTLFDQAVAGVLRHEPGMDVVAVEPRLAKIAAERIDVVLVNGHGDLGHAEALIRDLCAACPTLPIVAFGVPERESDALSLVEAGASGCVFLTDPLSRLVDAVHRVRRCEAVCSPRMAALALTRLAELAQDDAPNAPIAVSATLTRRELAVLDAIAEGLTNKAIADRFGITLSTVKNHVHNLLEKLRVHGRREAMRLACRPGMLVRTRSDLDREIH